MKKLEFSITINAPKQKVWDTMLTLETYQQWVGASWPDSTYEGAWEKGNFLKFIGEDKNGTLAEIIELKEYDYVLAKHVAILLADGVEDRESTFAQNWVGILENYFFSEKDGQTALVIKIETQPDWEKMFNDGWPKALAKLKSMCEQ
jgi:uncharacterized protein YndB with AHSA1/START domain